MTTRVGGAARCEVWGEAEDDYQKDIESKPFTESWLLSLSPVSDSGGARVGFVVSGSADGGLALVLPSC